MWETIISNVVILMIIFLLMKYIILSLVKYIGEYREYRDFFL